MTFLLRLADALKHEIVWLEWRPPKRRGAPPKEFGFEVVNHQTATRGISLMRDMLWALANYRATKGLPPGPIAERAAVDPPPLSHSLPLRGYVREKEKERE